MIPNWNFVLDYCGNCRNITMPEKKEKNHHQKRQLDSMFLNTYKINQIIAYDP